MMLKMYVKNIPLIHIRFATPNKYMHKTFYVSDNIISRVKNIISTPHRQEPACIQFEGNNSQSPYASNVQIPSRKQIELKRNIISRNNESIRLVVDDSNNKHNSCSERLRIKHNVLCYSNKPTIIKASPYNIELVKTEDSRQKSFPIGLKIPVEAADELKSCMRTVYSSDFNKLKFL